MNVGADVADANLRQDRWAVGIADHAEHAGIGAADKIISQAIGERASLAEGGNRAHDEFRVKGADRFVGKAQAPIMPGAKFSTITSTFGMSSLIIAAAAGFLSAE
jgi:hypothetical protein